MRNSGKGIDPFAFVCGLQNIIESRDSQDLNEFLKSILSQLLVSSGADNDNQNGLQLESHIKNIAREIFEEYLGKLTQAGSGKVQPDAAKDRESRIEDDQQTDLNTAENNTVSPAVHELGDIDESSASYQLLDDKEEMQIHSSNQDRVLNDSIPDSASYRDLPEKSTLRRELHLRPDVLETHSSLIIRVRIPKGMDQNDFRVRILPERAVIKWISGSLEQVIRLPCDIAINDAAAAIKDDILEITIPRSQHGDTREVNVFTL
jgi:HSP20 family molecular chaperone IbpA